MSLDIPQERAALQALSVRELHQRYAELFLEPTRIGDKPWLIKRLVWRLQALREGDLSERARRRAAELARDADLRLLPPRGPAAPVLVRRDRRLPPPGATLKRRYKGRT